jgi:uncharacterized protein YgbK (DUF1537 family)
MNPLIAVVADDLTGVCDTGAQFAAAGLRTVGGVDQEFRLKDIPEVLIVNTQSRSMGGAEASISVRQAVSWLRRFEPRWFFKKIDTALRGNIAVEVDSMMKTLGVDSVLYVASIPGAGRTTVRGCQLFRGIPIKESIHGEDRLNPNPIITSSNVELFSKVPGLEIEGVGFDEVRSGHLDISSHIRRGSKEIIVFDSETDEDIRRIVAASMEIEPSSFLYVGSFGLSNALGRHLSETLGIAKKEKILFDKRRPSQSGRRVLIVSGSSHPMARSQLSHLERKGKAEIVQFEPEDLTDRLDSCIQEAARSSRTLRDRKKGVILTIGEGKSGIRKQSQELVLALGKVVAGLLKSNGADSLVLVGGETGHAVCRALGIERIEILGNISFVAAYGKPEGTLTGVEILVTKGGSLGEEDTLEKVFDFIGSPACQ